MSKKISINPEFFKLSRSKKEKKKKKKPTFKESQLKPNQVKKKLIARIKEHQQKEKDREIKEKEKRIKNEDNKFKNEFKDTMDYLEELNKKKKKKKRKNKTLKNKHQIKHQIKHQNVDVKPMINLNNNINYIPPKSIYDSPNIKPQPPYGSLKNGTKPTYRQWRKTLKKTDFKIENNDEPDNIISNNENVIFENNKIEKFDFSDRKQKLEMVKNKLKIHEPKQRKLKTRRLRRKITLGKDKGKVGVLVKNKRTRKNIKHEINILKKKPITEIKEYLRKHNLMKIGSSAPDNICRGTYESAFLSGDIYNKNSDILLHNWNKEEDN